MVDEMIKGVEHMLQANKAVADIARSAAVTSFGAYTQLVAMMYLKGEIPFAELTKWENFVQTLKG